MSDLDVELTQTLGAETRDYIDAGYPALWIYSREQEDGLEELREAIYGEEVPLFVVWDAAQGMRRWMQESIGDKTGWCEVPNTLDFSDALMACERLSVINTRDGEPARLCAVFMNLHLHIKNEIRAQQFLNYVHRAETLLGQRFITLSTVPKPSPEILESYFTVISHKLPNREQLRVILHQVAAEDGDLPEQEEEVEAILDAAGGMTRSQAKNAFSLCLVRPPHQIEAMPIFEQKAKVLKNNELGLSLSRDRTTTFDHVVGMNNAKQSVLEMIGNTREMQKIHPELRPRGIVLFGLSGGGKSMFCKALGNSCVPSRPTLTWKLALTGSKYVSEGASKMQRVIDILEALAPCNLQVDEGLKARLASVGNVDGGSKVQAGEMDSLWLEYHEESTADVYPIFTANEEFIAVAEHEPEFRERFDEVFFIDYPTPEQLDQIWQYHMMLYKMIEHPDEYFDWRQEGKIPAECRFWVGRNVKTCCRKAKMRGLLPVQCPAKPEDAASSETAERMRAAAKKLGCMSAEYDAFYDPEHHQREMQKLLGARPPKRDMMRRRDKGKKTA